MLDLLPLFLAVAAFVLGHELLSHPLRAPLVGRIGEKGFLGVYSVLALATLFGAVELWRRATPDRLWQAPQWAYSIALVVMAFAFVLFVGSMTSPNPALMGAATGPRAPSGVQRITRHPMMWAFALWAIVHIILSADSRTIVLAGGVLTLALLGARLQDGKKLQQNPAYADHMARTGFVPFAAQFAGRQPWGAALPGAIPLVVGLILFGVTLYLHPLLVGVPAIPWSLLR